MNRLVFIIPILVQFSCAGTSSNSSVIKAGALKEDLHILRKTLEEAHPALYWYSEKRDMDKYFDSTEVRIDHDMSTLDFFKMMLPVISKARCSHTNIRLPQKFDKPNNSFKHELPFDFYCIEKKLFIRKDFTETGHEGFEVLSINNKPIDQIIDKLLISLPGDGFNETFKYHMLNAGAFREGFALFFDQTELFKLKGIDKDGKTMEFNVKGISPQQPGLLNKKPIDEQVLLSFRNNVALLNLNTFEVSNEWFRDTIATLFKSIKDRNISKLIIDIRKNPGGKNDNVSMLYSYIASKPFKHLNKAEINPPVYTYSKHFPDFKSWNSNIGGSPGKLLVNAKYAGTFLTEPQKQNLFEGKVVLLISGATGSAASEFAAITRFNKRATIVGEETAGCYYGATGGNYIRLRLPASGLEVTIPTISIYTAVEEDLKQPKGRGTIPHINVFPTIQEVMMARDIQLEKVILLLEGE